MMKDTVIPIHRHTETSETVIVLRGSGDEVTYDDDGHELERVTHLQLVQFIESAIKESEPDIIITHHPADTNNDHLQSSMACQEAIRLFQRRL